MLELTRRAHALGLAVRGAFHPSADEFDAWMPGVHVGTMVLLGFTGGEQWQHFARSPEATDENPDPLDRWSRRIIGLLAHEFQALDFYPNGASPQLPFQRLAARCEPVHRSPIGLLIHARWGLWHAYRGALGLPEALALPARQMPPHPCESCGGKPCLSGCPVGAFGGGGFNVKACVDHVRGPSGVECRERGCVARRACPIGSEHLYAPEQQKFHMSAFLAAMEPVP